MKNRSKLTIFLSPMRKNFYTHFDFLPYLLLLITITLCIVFPEGKYIFFDSFVLLLLLIYIINFKKIIFFVEKKGYCICSNNSKKIYNKINKITLPLLYLCFVTLIIIGILYLFNIVDNDYIELIIYLTLLILLYIESFYLRFLVIFSDNNFFVGNNCIYYSNISNIKPFKSHYSPLDDEEIIYFELFSNNHFLGFDKFYSDDFNMLISKVTIETNK